MLVVDLLVVHEPLRRRPIRLGVALILDEAAKLVDGRNGAVSSLHLHGGR
jgi:hypothetical protein